MQLACTSQDDRSADDPSEAVNKALLVQVTLCKRCSDLLAGWMGPATRSSFNVCFCDIDGTLVHYPEAQAKWGRPPDLLK